MLSRHAGNTEQIQPCSIAEIILRGLQCRMPRILSGSIVPGLRKLKKENERLKKIIAEKELEVALLQDAYKKKRGGEIIDR